MSMNDVEKGEGEMDLALRRMEEEEKRKKKKNARKKLTAFVSLLLS